MRWGYKMGLSSQDRLLVLLVLFLSKLWILSNFAKNQRIRTAPYLICGSVVVLIGVFLGPRQVVGQNSMPLPVPPPPQPADHLRPQRPATALAKPPDQNSQSAVRRIQSALERLGFQPGPKDGISGWRTQQAIKRFQTKIGGEPTGILTHEQHKFLWEAAS